MAHRASPFERLYRRTVAFPAPAPHDRQGRGIGRPCLIWQGATVTGGYGQIKVDGKGVLAHRLAYALQHGLMLDQFAEVDHLCRVRACVEPTHLEAVGQGENVRRGDTGRHNRIKTHCPAGHEYTPENTYVSPDGKRTCRECARVSGRRYDRAKRAKSHPRPNT